MTTKERILIESMKLFSVSGFDSVSIRTIADAVGVGNSALYKHYKNKQEIFDAIVEESQRRYLAQCARVTSDIRSVEKLKEVCLEMFEYQTKNDWIVMFRCLLLIEKFKNPKIADIYKEFFVDIPIHNQVKIFESLMELGLMKKGNARVYAMEFYAPFYLYHFVENDETELKKLFEEHVSYYFDEHFIKENVNATDYKQKNSQ